MLQDLLKNSKLSQNYNFKVILIWECVMPMHHSTLMTIWLNPKTLFGFTPIVMA